MTLQHYLYACSCATPQFYTARCTSARSDRSVFGIYYSLLHSHGIYNHTQKETRWFNFNVAKSRGPTPGQSGDATDLDVHADQNAFGR